MAKISGAKILIEDIPDKGRTTPAGRGPGLGHVAAG